MNYSSNFSCLPLVRQRSDAPFYVTTLVQFGKVASKIISISMIM